MKLTERLYEHRHPFPKMRKRLKDDTHDPFDYDDDESTTNKLLLGVMIAFVAEVVACLVIITVIVKYGDVIDNFFTW